MPELIIKPHSDIKVLLDGKPFAFTHLSLETEIESPLDGETGMPIISYETGRILRAYQGDVLLAASRNFDIDPTTRTIRFQ